MILDLNQKSDYNNFLLAEEYQDFKEFLSDELGSDYLNELWEKFQNRP